MGVIKARPRSSLRLRFIFFFLLIYLCTTAALVLYLYSSQVASMRQRLSKDKDYLLVSLSGSLVLPMWNFDSDAIRRLLASSMAYPDLEQVAAYDDDGRYIGGVGRSGSGGAERYAFQPSAREQRNSRFSGSAAILYKGKQIGRVELSVTDRYARSSLMVGLWRSVALSAIIILAGIAALFLLLELGFLRRLLGLRDALSAFSSSELDVRAPLRENDEIGDLASDFNGLANRIQAYAIRLESLVDERTELLREVHHRVKNNLQIVTSLISLALDDPDRDPLRVMAEIQSRISTMALVHEQIYASSDFDTIDCAALLEEMAGASIAGAGLEPAGLLISRGSLSLRLDLAIPFALLLNEQILCAARRCGAGPIEVGFRERDAEGLVGFYLRSTSFLGGDLSGPEACGEVYDGISEALSRQLNGRLEVGKGEALDIQFSFKDGA